MKEKKKNALAVKPELPGNPFQGPGEGERERESAKRQITKLNVPDMDVNLNVNLKWRIGPGRIEDPGISMGEIHVG